MSLSLGRSTYEGGNQWEKQEEFHPLSRVWGSGRSKSWFRSELPSWCSNDIYSSHTGWHMCCVACILSKEAGQGHLGHRWVIYPTFIQVPGPWGFYNFEKNPPRWDFLGIPGENFDLIIILCHWGWILGFFLRFEAGRYILATCLDLWHSCLDDFPNNLPNDIQQLSDKQQSIQPIITKCV